MCVYFRIFLSLMLLLIFTYGNAFAWLLKSDFELGTIAERASGTSGFGEAGQRNLFSNAGAFQGQQSSSISWLAGDTGYVNSTGRITFPEVSDSEEIWIRGYFLFQEGWSFICSPVIKIIRAHVVKSDGLNRGHVSIFAGSSGNIIYSNEVNFTQYNTPVLFDIGIWQAIELYIRFSVTNPVVRIWKNGELVYERTDEKTLAISSDKSREAYFMPYWNGGAPKAQTQFLDNIVITNEAPNNFDIHGNPMIGMREQTVSVPNSPQEFMLLIP